MCKTWMVGAVHDRSTLAKVRATIGMTVTPLASGGHIPHSRNRPVNIFFLVLFIPMKMFYYGVGMVLSLPHKLGFFTHDGYGYRSFGWSGRPRYGFEAGLHPSWNFETKGEWQHRKTQGDGNLLVFLV